MYIAPNSTIKILSGVPLDNTYEHTVYFENATVQYNMFNLFTKYNNVNYTYQRVNEGKIKVEKKADLLYDCNYLMFQNTNYGTKWFYAFITAVEFVNNETSEITYEIDPMQTWYFDYTVEDSFVEREHILADVVGSNLVPENLELGEYMYGLEYTLLPYGASDSFDIIIAATWRYADGEFEPYGGGNFGGTFSGLFLNHFGSDGTGTAAEKAAACLQEAAEATGNQTEGIVAVYMIPTWMWQLYYAQATAHFDVTISKIANYQTQVWGFEPKNNKLKTSPFISLVATNNKGDFGEYPAEFFTSVGGNPTFRVYGTFTPDGRIELIPLHYKGQEVNYAEHMSLEALPQCSYNVDAFKAWLAQNNITIGTKLATDLVSGSVGAMIGDGAGAISSLTSVANTLATITQSSFVPRSAKGTNSSTLCVIMNRFKFTCFYKFIRPEFAHIIDEYFNVYGYATHRVKKPNIGTRPHWNYVKTLRVNLRGSVPANDMKKIASIYDKGITFWKYFSEIGDYSLDNSPS